MATIKKYVKSVDIRSGVWNAIDRLMGTVFTPTAGRTITGSTTLEITDVGTTLRANSATAVVITIPNDTTVAWTGDTVISAYQLGAGVVSFAAGAGVTLRSPAGIPTSVQYSVTGAMRVAANEWVLI